MDCEQCEECMLLRNRFLVKLLLLDQPVAERSEAEISAEIARNYRWNFTANFLDGVWFYFGIAFASSSTIIPLFVSKITLNPLIFGLVAMIAQAGWFIPQLFTADKIEQLDRKKPVIINLGLFTERLPVLLWPLAAYLAKDYPIPALIIFLIGYAGHGLGAGLVGPAWQDLIARCFAVNKRGFMLGLTTFAGTAAGTAGAALSSWYLDKFEFPTNFVILFSIASVGVMLSWVSLAQVREPVQRTKAHPHATLSIWSRMITILNHDVNFRSYLIARMLLILGAMGTGFVTVMSLERWSLSDGVVGGYTAILLLGQTAGNLVAGVLADRVGHKLPLVIGGIAQVLAFSLAWMATQPEWIYGVFALMGVAAGVHFVSGMLITMEFSESARRPTYVGIANTACGIALGVAPLLGGWIAGFGYSWLFGSGALLGLFAVLLMQWTVVEPRRVPVASASVVESA
jgi:MFS family permease